MATITGLTAERMLEIEGSSVIDGDIVSGHLILTKHDGTTVDAGALPPGPAGPIGPAGGQIPGEIKMWSGSVLPPSVEFGNWVWADGATYAVADNPKAAANIAPQWRTFAGASDPPPHLFRVPDLRGLVPAGMDAMPGGSRANRLTRSVSIVIAGKTGEEIHTVTVAEMPAHAHGVTDPGHVHYSHHSSGTTGPLVRINTNGATTLGSLVDMNAALTGISIQNQGGGVGHENLQPTVFVPYIVKLD